MTIYQVSIVDNNTGEIIGMYVPGATPPDEGVDENNSGRSIVHMTSEVPNPVEYQQTKYYKDGAWKTREWKGDYYTWKSNETWEFNSTAFWEKVRADRDWTILRTDWTQLPDSPLSDSKKAEWAEYRTALRDVPSNNESATRLDDIVWPDKPS